MTPKQLARMPQWIGRLTEEQLAGKEPIGLMPKVLWRMDADGLHSEAETKLAMYTGNNAGWASSPTHYMLTTWKRLASIGYIPVAESFPS